VSAHVRVALVDGSVEVEVSDDGVGGADADHGSGLSGLRDRVEALNGRLSVESSVGAGTVVRAQVPVRTRRV
jgi:signal transduction histidine kinase